MPRRKVIALRDSIEAELVRHPEGLTATALIKLLELRGAGRRRLFRMLSQMTSAKRLVRDRNGRVKLAEDGKRTTGRIAVSRSGRGFMKIDGVEVRIDRSHMGSAMPGDTVTVRMRESDREGGPPVAEVVGVTQRARPRIAGTVVSEHGRKYVYPLSPNYRNRFRVAQGLRANPGDRVLVRLIESDGRDEELQADIVEIVGSESEAALDTKAVVAQYDFPVEFSDEVVAAAERATERMEERDGREDLTNRFILTIDPLRARDFDDALSITRNEKGEVELGVHIADVSHYVRPGEALDEAAFERGNSVYLPDMVIPMLPVHLSNGVCSLLPERERLTVSVWMTYDANTRLLSTRFSRSVIRSRVRLTYEEVMAGLNTGRLPEAHAGVADETMACLRQLSELAQGLRRKRMAREALDLDLAECELDVDEGGVMTGFHLVKSDPSHQLVEECMVAANRAVASCLAEAGYPSVYRIHGTPDPARLERLAVDLEEMLGRRVRVETRSDMAALLKSVQGHALETSARRAMLRSMRRAVYSHELDEHYALAIPVYSHFTSPIRRYPDLIVHRQLMGWLAKQPGPHDVADCARMVDACNRHEQDADDAERDVAELKKLRFLQTVSQSSRPQSFAGYVVETVKAGLFIELRDLQMQGFLHYRNLGAMPRTGRGRAGRGQTPLKAGDDIRVKPIAVDLHRHRVDLAPVWE